MKKSITIIGAGGQMGQWFSKYFTGKDFQVTGFDEENKIKGKIVALQSIFHFLTEKYDKGHTETNNFHFYEDKDGNFTIRFDQI